MGLKTTPQNDFTQENPPVMTYPLLHVIRSGYRHNLVYEFIYQDDKPHKTYKKTVTDYTDDDGNNWVQPLISQEMKTVQGVQIDNSGSDYFFLRPMNVPTRLTPTQSSILERLVLSFHQCKNYGYEP